MPPANKTLKQFADLMIKKIESVSDNWSTPWVSNKSNGMPQNISGREYHGLNALMLYINQEEKGYKTPVHMTFLQAQENNVMIKKGAKSFPVAYWGYSIKHKDTGEKITLDAYNKLSQSQKNDYKVTPFLCEHRVFNIEQTTFPEVYTEKWEKLQEKFKAPELKDEAGMLKCLPVDVMLGNNNWLCPINMEHGDRTFYSPAKDYIRVPLKGQFKNGETFYSTLIHEMAHSTGHESRLNRDQKNIFGDPKYAKEELVAEFTAAVTCQSLGISSTVQEENAQYLKGWLGAIKEEPNFLLSVLSDVSKATDMITSNVEQQIKKDQKTTLFNENEIPFNEFSQLGFSEKQIESIKKENLSDLLDGKKTKELSFSLTVNGKTQEMKGAFSLQRNPDNSVSLLFSQNNIREEKNHSAKFKR